MSWKFGPSYIAPEMVFLLQTKLQVSKVLVIHVGVLHYKIGFRLMLLTRLSSRTKIRDVD